jgi:hypothetical protein
MEYDLVGINEIATMAGVSSQAVANWRVRSSDFPQPLKELASGPVFRCTQIRAWLKRNNRKLGTLEESSSYYPRLKSFRNDDEALSTCIEDIVDDLESASTSGDKPGMLLGKIQSGKTRGFVGVIAKSFDRGFDMAIVLTKGTKTLSAQTVRRLESDFAEFIEDDEFLVVDIMNVPGTLRRSELRRKVVIVAKKQARNLDKLIEFIGEHEDLQNRKVLLVDDEADLASVRFVRKAGDPGVNQGTIADQIDQLRGMTTGIAFLQVTATPYSLYLQPEDYDEANTNYVFKPKRPAFTKLLPIHSGYVGGDDYFGPFEGDDPRSQLIVEVAEQEQDALRRPDKRRISANNVLETDNVTGLRRAIITFVVAVGVRRWQQCEGGERAKKYAMVIHNDIARAAHAWQDQVIDWIFHAIVNAAENGPAQLRPLFDAAYDDLETSVVADKGKIKMPPRDDAFDAFIDALQSDDVAVEKVNSDTDVMALLDANAELKLRTPYNIWVGGNILDRGITIPNLISFYYGRNPKTMQADTVLQHSRMYGNRDRRDLAVTRFYTSRAVYDRLYTINALEGSLRNAFETGAHDAGVVFIQSDAARRVRPCAPNKVLLSDVVAVSPNDMLLPSDFQTKGGTEMAKIQAELDRLIKPEWRDIEDFVAVDRKTIIAIINAIEKSMEFDTVEFEWDAMRGLIDYYADVAQGGDGKILIFAETGRKLSRAGSGDKSGRSVLGTALRRKVLGEPRSKPALILLQQEGGRELGWTAHKFWWPLFAAPTDAEPCVFATKVAN